MHADEHVLYSSEFLLDCAVGPPQKMPQLKENGVVDDVAAIEGADILFMQCPIMAVFLLSFHQTMSMNSKYLKLPLNHVLYWCTVPHTICSISCGHNLAAMCHAFMESMHHAG